MVTETKSVHIFGFTCYCFSSAFSFPLLRCPPPCYISQHIIGWWVCECVYLEPWDEECGYPLVWPGTQGHLTLSFSVKTKFHLKYNLTHLSSYLLSPTVPSLLLCSAGALSFWVGQRPWGQHQTICSELFCEETMFGHEASNKLWFPSAGDHNIPWEHLIIRSADQVGLRSAVGMVPWTHLLSGWLPGCCFWISVKNLGTI